MPASEAASRRILALPIYPESTRAQREEVVDAIADFLKK